jgi:LmbE family N-acetylglucosaminyl deacetylase
LNSAAYTSPAATRRLWARSATRLVHACRALHANILTRWLIHFHSRKMHLTSASAMIFAPHQDDETFGCGGMIARKRELGAQVIIVFLTDGRNSHPYTSASAQADLISTRRKEALAATRHLGVPPACLHFLDLPDSTLRNLSEHDESVTIEAVISLIERHRPAEVYVPHRHDQLDDHEAAFNLLYKAIATVVPTPQLLQYPMWMAWLAPTMMRLKKQDFASATALSISSALSQKRRAISCYRSQLQILPPGFAIRFNLPHELYFDSIVRETRRKC